MAFKLGSESRKFDANGKNKFDKGDLSVPGVEIIRKNLPAGVDAEANNDGTIFLGEHIQPGSEQERKVLMHEMKHMVDMQTGKLAYNDTTLTWMGEKYERHRGMINYNGEWLPEGSTKFPWERH